jgi:NAD(P)H-dependent FMN reductase
MLIPIISGTNRPGNLSIHVAKHVEKLLAARELTTELLTLENLPVSMALADFYGGQSPDFTPFQELIDQSQYFVFVAPEYNGSIPGILKLFIDACQYPGSFKGKRAALIGVSAGIGGNVTGLRHLDDILTFLGVEVLPHRVHAGRIREKLHPDGILYEPQLLNDLEAQVDIIRAEIGL